MDKPPTIRVGVEGFNAFAAKPEPPLAAIDWHRLAELPAFQMFMADRVPNEAPPSWALYDEYCQWHTAKGYWPNETPMGELKDVVA